jgi:dihydroorotate dehydrogenase
MQPCDVLLALLVLPPCFASQQCGKPASRFVSLIRVQMQAYDGPALVPRMKRDLVHCLRADGFASVQDAIAADHR